MTIKYKKDAFVFVFGSNLAGVHGAGAALFAKRHRGAVQGQGIGPQGDSYAIPTKDERIETLPLELIKPHIEEFFRYAAAHPTVLFQVTRIGCGLAGFTDEQIAPLFKVAPKNCIMPLEWLPFVGDFKTWGSFDQ
ncbi:MAG: hypothetical protein E6R04_00720 [Spirochaetes bacterium]|jgi:hypothetical protein|nr:MAG: hypothetical protein E6R04_00720 [Spirochaetota bacterium]